MVVSRRRALLEPLLTESYSAPRQLQLYQLGQPLGREANLARLYDETQLSL